MIHPSHVASALKTMAIKKQKRSLEDANIKPSENGAPKGKFQKTLGKPTIKSKPEAAIKTLGKEKPTGKAADQKAIKKEVVEKTVQVKKETPAGEAAPKAEKSAKLLKKNEKRKLARKEKGQYNPQKITLTPDQIKERIENIRTRPELSRTARRKIGLYKRMLGIVEGTYVPKPKPRPESLAITKSMRRHLRKKKRAAEYKARVASENDPKKFLMQTPVVKKEEGKSAAPAANKKQKPAQQKKNKAEQKKKEIVLTKAEPEDSEEDDDDEDDEDEEIEMNTSGISNTSEEQTDEEDDDDDDEEDDDDDDEEDDDEDDEDDDDEDEEDEEEKKPALPAKKAPETDKKVVAVKKENVQKEAKKQEIPNGVAGKKKRFVLFVGNLPFTATVADVKKHFLTKVSAVTDVRLPTKPDTKQSKGIAYVELTNETDYQKALTLHNSNLNGRRINVEYTQGGSKSAGKKVDIVAKNKKLHGLRKQGKWGGKPDNRNDRRKKQKTA